MIKMMLASALCISFSFSNLAFGQVDAHIINGQLMLDNVIGTPRREMFNTQIKAIDQALKTNPKDTIALFERALLLDKFNNILAVPYQDDRTALLNLIKAERYAFKADSLEMKDLRLKVLRSQIYKDLVYRYLGDQRWKYNNVQVVSRRRSFESYKKATNERYTELIKLDSANAYYYRKLMELSEYPIK